MFGSVRTGGQGEFGSVENVRPATWLVANHCPWGHDLRIGGRSSSYSHFLGTYVDSCNACRVARRNGDWVPIDPALQHPADTAPGKGIALVVVPPPVRAGVGHVRVHLNGTSIGDIDLSLCPVDQRAVIEQVRVDEDYRRHGFGRLLVAAALARAPHYTWSTTTVTAREARAFWAAVGEPTNIGEPHWCSHMRIASGGTP
ncbi:GNAT family N-acetyltransferase [Amycolatopsis acididurans]|nr:GNAT family N-acetyltransferase [Amycolatopsis acididurans]